MIIYDKLFKLLEENNVNTYTLKKEGIIGQGSYYAIKNGTGGLDHRSINKLCKYLNCQPGDLMEYVPDKEENT